MCVVMKELGVNVVVVYVKLLTKESKFWRFLKWLNNRRRWEWEIWNPRCFICQTQDKLTTFWEVKKEEYEKLRAEFRNRDRVMEELEERHQLELKVGVPAMFCPVVMVYLKLSALWVP